MTSSLMEPAVLFLVSFAATCLAYGRVLKIGIGKDIMDKPCSRKLQQAPVPVLGGVAVFLGIVAATVAGGMFPGLSGLCPAVCVMALMLCTGVADDILGLSPGSRIAIEILAVLALTHGTGCGMDDLHGLWGVGRLPDWLAVCLTAFAGVGIINAVNMIDGVNGLCSGYCIFACCALGVFSSLSGDTAAAALAAACTGALLPFLGHNVFGARSKMFLGDGGTMLMGTAMVFLVTGCLHGGEVAADAGRVFHPVPFTLAVLSVPVFDTVRVMCVRVLHGRSPFSPDRGHLHHLLFEIHFSHVGTTCTEILLGMTVTGAWLAACALGVSAEAQLYVVAALGFCLTFGLYALVVIIRDRQPGLYAALCRLGDRTHFGHSRWFLRIRAWMDR